MKKLVLFSLIGVLFLVWGCDNLNMITEPETPVSDTMYKQEIINGVDVSFTITTDKINYELGEIITATYENPGDTVYFTWGGCKGKFYTNLYYISQDGIKLVALLDPSLPCPCFSVVGPYATNETGYCQWDQIHYGMSSLDSESFDWTSATIPPPHQIIDADQPFLPSGNGYEAPAGYYVYGKTYLLNQQFSPERNIKYSNVFSIGIEEDTTEYIETVIETIPDDAVSGPADQRLHALQEKLDEVQALIDAGEYQTAIDKLEKDIRPKTDGCVGGNPNNDWITDCDIQVILIGTIDGLIAQLQELV